MNKDLICITAHCPNEEKRRILHNLVLSLQPIRKDLIINSTTFPGYCDTLQEKLKEYNDYVETTVKII